MTCRTTRLFAAPAHSNLVPLVSECNELNRIHFGFLLYSLSFLPVRIKTQSKRMKSQGKQKKEKKALYWFRARIERQSRWRQIGLTLCVWNISSDDSVKLILSNHCISRTVTFTFRTDELFFRNRSLKEEEDDDVRRSKKGRDKISGARPNSCQNMKPN